MEINPVTTMVSTKLRAILVLLVGLLISSGIQGGAQPSLDRDKRPKACSVTFRLYPDSATVWRQTGEGRVNFLGDSDEAVTIGLTEQEASGERDLLIHFKVALWFDEWASPPEFIAVDEVRATGVFPNEGRRKLELSTWELFQAHTAAHPLLSLGVLFSVIGGAGLAFRWHKQSREPKPEMSLVPGYRLQEKLGQGGMGVVHAVQDEDGHRYAVKLLKKAVSASREFQEQFDRELSVGVKLAHPNLPRLFGYGVSSDGRAYMVTELFEGQTLKQLMESGDFVSAHLAAEVLEQIGSALDYLHQNNLVHQDVKPSNIFCCLDGTFRLLDMGIVKSVDSVEPAKKIVGSPLYMAPEQFQGSAEPRSDQYSLGLVLYEILLGRRPTDVRDPVVLSHQRSTSAPEPIGWNEVIDNGLLRMLDPDASKRFADFQSARRVLTDEFMAF